MTNILEVISGVLWSNGMLLLFVAVGVCLAVAMRGYPFRRGMILRWLKEDKGAKKEFKSLNSGKKSHNEFSQFQAVSTALAAAMGTGNITGVAAALAIGGPGALFWMWIAAFIGMFTAFAENVSGISYQGSGKNGVLALGPIATWANGLGRLNIGVLYAVICLMVSFGMGGMAQSNAIIDVVRIQNFVRSDLIILGVVAIISISILRGVSKIAQISKLIIPVLSCIYIFVALMVLIKNLDFFPSAITSIFKSAFGLPAAVGGLAGHGIKTAMTVGFRRGVFSNEAGLGTSALVHGSVLPCGKVISQEERGREAVRQGAWAAMEVFFDTIICCTITGVSVMVGLEALGVRAEDCVGNEAVILAFSTAFGNWTAPIISVIILFFAFATILGWSVYGSKAFDFLTGGGHQRIYQILFIGAVVAGALVDFNTVWTLCDIFNGLMAIPNLLSLLLLSKEIGRIVVHHGVQYKKRR